MISCLQEIYPVSLDKINDSVLLCNSARPAAGKPVFESLRFAFAFKGGPEYFFNEAQYLQGRLPVLLNPPDEILPKLILKNCITLSICAFLCQFLSLP